ncbi:hypothetical protein DFH28DRAFT_1140811 [Melampsora americana]|nr:hypothetical protein DFH28DRAFT_1140811 [Melampsora americana]
MSSSHQIIKSSYHQHLRQSSCTPLQGISCNDMYWAQEATGQPYQQSGHSNPAGQAYQGSALSQLDPAYVAGQHPNQFTSNTHGSWERQGVHHLNQTQYNNNNVKAQQQYGHANGNGQTKETLWDHITKAFQLNNFHGSAPKWIDYNASQNATPRSTPSIISTSSTLAPTAIDSNTNAVDTDFCPMGNKHAKHARQMENYLAQLANNSKVIAQSSASIALDS